MTVKIRSPLAHQSATAKHCHCYWRRNRDRRASCHSSEQRPAVGSVSRQLGALRPAGARGRTAGRWRLRTSVMRSEQRSEQLLSIMHLRRKVSTSQATATAATASERRLSWPAPVSSVRWATAGRPGSWGRRHARDAGVRCSWPRFVTGLASLR